MTAALPPTRSSIRRFTTGSAWPWHCGTSRSPTFPFAIRVSTCPTAATTSKTPHAFHPLARLKQGHRTIGLSGPTARVAGTFPGLPVIDRAQVPRGMPRLRRGLPNGGDRHSTATRGDWTWADVCSAPTASRPAHRSRCASPATIAWRRGGARTSSRRSGLPAGRCPGGEIAAAVRPLAQTPPGERRRLQRLRGGHQRAGHGGLGPGPFRHPVRRLAAPRRRPGRSPAR